MQSIKTGDANRLKIKVFFQKIVKNCEKLQGVPIFGFYFIFMNKFLTRILGSCYLPTPSTLPTLLSCSSTFKFKPKNQNLPFACQDKKGFSFEFYTSPILGEFDSFEIKIEKEKIVSLDIKKDRRET